VVTIALDRLTPSGFAHGTTPARLDLALPADPASVGQARRATGAFCRQNGLPAEVTDDVVLTTSELVTNTVVHARTPLLLTLEIDAGHVTVSVADGSPVPPRFGGTGPPGAGRAHPEPQRGMAVVGQFGPWGVFRIPLGKTVWTSITTRPATKP
jgi:hypothetical protein